LTGTQKEVTKEHFYQKELEESNTKAKVALTELRLLNKYNRLILDNSNSGFIYLTPDYIVKWENVLTMKSSNKFMQGYKKGCLCYKTLRGLDSPCRNCIMDLAIATKQKIAQEMTNEYGEIVNVLAIPVYSSDKSISGVVLRIDDVTQLRKSYNELQIAKDKAERSDRFKSTFLANMSHEIRTPLNAIIGFSELMADVESKEERHKYSEIIMTNNTLLLKLVSDILDLSRIEAGYINIKNEEFDIAQLYKELDITFTPKMPRDVVFICDITQKPCVVNLDKGRLTQVITNFITNAIKFTKKGYIKIGYELIGDELKLYVTDTGIGIAQENIALVFERFEKLNNFVQGTGLGLSICRSIIEAENGKIGVNSQFGKGSTFWATIPCKEGL
ncbi:MAG: HAMP domain-containing sensor histidine kinase, partial [Bacteroidales bacterium]